MLNLFHIVFLLRVAFSSPTGVIVPPIKVISFAEFEQLVEKPSDKIRVYNFWATWCAPCVKEMPVFEKVSAEDSEVLLIFISMDDGRRPERVSAFMERKGIKSEVYLLDDVDYNSWITKVSEKWSGAIPATLFVTPDGKRLFHEGEMDEQELKAIISRLR
jgi:thiol-disulfide isomerase/thioredoxin